MSEPTSSATPGELLLHPIALIALVVLVVNDHWMKAAWPGTAVGKISDFAGLVVFPLALLSLVELGRRALHRPATGSFDSIAAVMVCGLGFLFVKTTELGRDAYAWAVGSVRWPVQAFGGWLHGEEPSPVHPIGVVRDVTDLVALAALVVPYALIRSRARKFDELVSADLEQD
ncbi:hypothetical protein ASC77_14245 [Nocardioides sp. Root1257]|uniref:hypothetical protein n=1 Tax=unclassified Nocardioides TaxID=2615069 RepID=UPI000700E46E|nr:MULTISPECIES: hypothetical protein [unclassified Nocardioides]KQW47601.1 hypothetical protein ASC77_14245 [Nocardioides sp. Root1257]KRC45756.1 hypothetical protein ASE24_14245 [Nocardioides sp. Root224]